MLLWSCGTVDFGIGNLKVAICDSFRPRLELGRHWIAIPASYGSEGEKSQKALPSLARLILLLGAIAHLAAVSGSVGLNFYSDDNCKNQFAAVAGDGGVYNEHSLGWSPAMANPVTHDTT
ncbi:hypothetical protein PRZ48_002114 [Zasmidium cellare]|uniref:Uncharacterized protein n=1 Tax=Zasmidium cellare TaxID=395010 RepID=A0ABR0F4W8_ZASCE|nr:hypothetical protein PRZ48_002114 [Zasmidium cellare]